MGDMPEKITLTIAFDASQAAASHWLSMAEAALDFAWPSWRSLPMEERQGAKDAMMHILFEAGRDNPVGARNGIERPSPFVVRAVK